jgi:hypothetical protein
MMWQTELGYIVRDAIEHGVSPVEFGVMPCTINNGVLR